MSVLQPWSVTAVNLPEHEDNAIHTDEGARAAGFDGALVAGVTTYAYMTHVPASAWGLTWLTNGGADVRFRSPVMDGERVDLVVGEASEVTASVGGTPKAHVRFSAHAEHLPEREGAALEPIEFVVDDSWSDYGFRAGDDCSIYTAHGIAHATSWPRIANQFCHEQLVDGSWIHVRSRIAHHGVALVGSTIRATAMVAARFDSRAGERAILDVRIAADGTLVASVEHEAIIRLADAKVSR